MGILQTQVLNVLISRKKENSLVKNSLNAGVYYTILYMLMKIHKW